MILESETDMQAEYRSIQRNFRIVGLVVSLVLAFGTIFYHLVEKFSWLNSLYFCVITLTTVGYGDLVPHTDAGKLFTIVYILTGIGVLATFANLILKNALARRQLKRPREARINKDDIIS